MSKIERIRDVVDEEARRVMDIPEAYMRRKITYRRSDS